MQVKSPKAFNQRIYNLIKDAMDLKGDLSVSPQDAALEVGCISSGVKLQSDKRLPFDKCSIVSCSMASEMLFGCGTEFQS